MKKFDCSGCDKPVVTDQKENIVYELCNGCLPSKSCFVKVKDRIMTKVTWKQLFDYLDGDSFGGKCYTDFRATKKFCKKNKVNFEQLEETITEEYGQGCDCEILMNIRDGSRNVDKNEPLGVRAT